MPTLIPSIGSCLARMTRVENTIQILTMKVSKGLEFPVVALPRLGHILLRVRVRVRMSRRRLGCFMWLRLGLRRCCLSPLVGAGELLSDSLGETSRHRSNDCC